jgi:O-antigen/teichoic acid export membrane protein
MEGRDTFTKRIVSAFAWEGSTKLAIQVASWISTIYVARLLVPEDYGIVAISGLFTGVLTLITEFGLGAGIVTRREINADQYNRCFWLGIIASVVLYMVLFFAAPLVADAYDTPLLRDIIRVAALGLIISSIRIVPYSQVLRALDYRFRSLTEMFGQFVQAGSTVLLAVFGHGAWSLVIGYLVAQSIMTFIFTARASGISWPAFSLTGLRDLIDFGVKITGARLLGFFVSNCDQMVISSLLGTRYSGLYSVSANLATAPLDKIGAIFNRVAFPILARLQENPETARKLFLRFHFYLLVIASPILVGLGIVAREAVTILLSPKWAPAFQVLQILCFANVIRLSGMVFPTILEGLGMAGAVFRYQMLSAALMPLGFLIGSHWGLQGVTSAWLIAYPLVYLWLLRKTLSVLDIRIGTFLDSTKPVLAANVVMAGAVLITQSWLLDWHPAERLSLLVAVGAVVYFTALGMLLPKSAWSEMRDILRGLRN